MMSHETILSPLHLTKEVHKEILNLNRARDELAQSDNLDLPFDYSMQRQHTHGCSTTIQRLRRSI
jgi:hypothetical protein